MTNQAWQFRGAGIVRQDSTYIPVVLVTCDDLKRGASATNLNLHSSLEFIAQRFDSDQPNLLLFEADFKSPSTSQSVRDFIYKTTFCKERMDRIVRKIQPKEKIQTGVLQFCVILKEKNDYCIETWTGKNAIYEVYKTYTLTEVLDHLRRYYDEHGNLRESINAQSLLSHEP